MKGLKHVTGEAHLPANAFRLLCYKRVLPRYVSVLGVPRSKIRSLWACVGGGCYNYHSGGGGNELFGGISRSLEACHSVIS
jgi:hypothetical protein